jgi:hypothetical protein
VARELRTSYTRDPHPAGFILEEVAPMRSSHVALTLFLVPVASGLSACSVSYGVSHEIDHAKAENFLSSNIHPTPKSVTCPSGVKEKKGGTFACAVKLADGKTASVTIHMTDDKGGVHVGDADIHVKS